MKRPCLLLTIPCLLVAATAFAGDRMKPAPADMASTPLISREVLFGNADRGLPQISPDGKLLAYLSEVDGVQNVWVTPINNPGAAKAVSNEKKRGIQRFRWAANSEVILYPQDSGGDENWHIQAANVKTGKTIDLTPIDGIAAQMMGASHRVPDEILIGINDRDRQLHDVYRVNVRSGERKLVQKNEGGYAQFLADDDLTPRLAMKITPEGGGELHKKEGGAWTLCSAIPSADSLTTAPEGFDKSGNVVYLRDSRDRNTSGLFAWDIKKDQKRLIAADDRCDADDAMIHPTEKTVEAVAFNFDRKRWKIIDPTIKPDMDYLATVAGGDMEVASRSNSDKDWIVSYMEDNGPVRFYHYDRAAKKARFLFSNRSKLESLPLSRMHPVVIKSRDGMDLVSYLTLPAWVDQKGNGRPSAPVPMVLFVHGGPWARDEWGLNPYHQWLSNRGYAVLSVNFRGSTGLGKNFTNAGNHEWAGNMHNDLLDAVNWAVKEKIADPKKVAIMGGSYGGYSTLVGVTFTPDVFTCGVDIVGPSNLVTLLQSVPPYWKPMLDMMTQRVGDHRTEEGRKLLKSRSPLNFVDRIKKPLLIGQGANDPRVKQAEADQIVNAMKAKKIPVTYVLYPDEGHGFRRPENSKSFNAIVEAFLAKQLGGRFEPIGADFKGSSVTAPDGAGDVPGLAEALKAR